MRTEAGVQKNQVDPGPGDAQILINRCSTDRFSGKLGDEGEQPAYSITVALCLQREDQRAKELTESPLAEVTDVYALYYAAFQYAPHS